MRQKLREIRCLDDKGNEALVIEWGFGVPGTRQVTNRELRMEDGSPGASSAGPSSISIRGAFCARPEAHPCSAPFPTKAQQ
jgi:hypothetical protein